MPAPIILTVGSLHYDIMVEADHLPRKDETSVGSRWYPKFGGKGGNQAVAVAKAGLGSRMFGAVGQDDFGPFLRTTLQRAGVEDAFVATIPNVGSGMSVAIQDGEGDYAATIVSGANLQANPRGLEQPALWADVALLILQNEMPEALNKAAAEQARLRGVRSVLNAAPARSLSPEMLGLVDILVVNAVEAEMMGTKPVTDLDSAATAATHLAHQFKSVIVTAGSIGLAGVSEGQAVFTLPAEKVSVVSSHGAGDAFIGAFCAALVRNASFEGAATAASLAAAKHVSTPA